MFARGRNRSLFLRFSPRGRESTTLRAGADAQAKPLQVAMFQRVLPFLFLLALASTGASQTTTWLGTSSTAWSTAANWSHGVPTSATNASIPRGTLRQPTLTGMGACRNLVVETGTTLTLAARATLDLFGNAQASGLVTGSGYLVTRASVSTLTGRFGTVVAESTSRLTSSTSLSGSLIANADVLLYSACTLGSLSVAGGRTVTIQSTATSSVVVTGGLSVATGGLIDNPAAVPLVLRGTSHAIAGTIRGDLALEVAALTRFLLTGVVSGDVDAAVDATQRLTVAGLSVGRITGALAIVSTSAGRCEAYLDDIRAGDISVTAANAWISGSVTTGEFRTQHVQLKGVGTDDELIVDTLVIWGATQMLDDPPERIVVREGVVIGGSNSFVPVRGSIVFNNPTQPTTVSVSDNPLPRFSEVVVENGAQVQFRSGTANMSGKGPRIQNLVVSNGTADAIYCTLDQILVEPAGTLTVRTEQAAHQNLVGPTVVRGTATFTDTDFGSTLPLLANDLTVQNGGTVLVGNGGITVSGSLRVAGATLRLGAGVPLVLQSSGRLVLDGTPTAPALVQGSNSAMQLGGTVEARGFRFTGMSGAGVRLTSTAVLGAVPFDFRGGHFTGGQPGGVLLDVVRSAATSFFDLDFDNAGGATRNVRATVTSALLTFVDARGNLAGEAFDDDSGNRIGWRANGTTVAEFSVAPGVHRVLATVRTTAEETTAFRLNRAPGGPLASFAASGPRTYSLVDDGLLAGTRYTYTLERERLSPFAPQWQPLATASATPHAANEGVTRFVGPNGYANVAAALSGAPAGTIVFVAAGSYGGFTIATAARVIGAGGVTITSPVTVTNVSGGGDVVLDGLQFAPGAGVTASDVATPLVLRALVLPGNATFESLRVTRCPKVALQRLTVGGNAVAVTSTVHAASSTFGAVAVTQTSRFVHAATTAVSITPDGSSTARGLPGPSAVLDLAPAWPTNTPQPIAIRQGGAGHAFGLLLATAHDYVDLSAALPLDMVLLLSPSSLIALPGGLLDAAGNANLTLPGPATPHTVGRSLHLQVHTLDPTTLRLRFAELRQLLLLR